LDCTETGTEASLERTTPVRPVSGDDVSQSTGTHAEELMVAVNLGFKNLHQLAVDNMVWRANTDVTQDGGGHGDTLACITFTTISTTAE